MLAIVLRMKAWISSAWSAVAVLPVPIAQTGNDVAEEISILYGGSCKPSNAKEIFSKTNVDGGLIGGAALKAEDFMGIVDAF